MMEHDEAWEICSKIAQRVNQVYVGEELLLKKVLAAALVNGNVLFEDNPGLGKTLLAKAFAGVIGGGYSRIQFTPDMLPADILGTNVWRPHQQVFEFIRGPVFANILLADEINRTTPKTQSALLEAMEERQLTIEGRTHKLEEPFFVLATQNPIEYEGTYPLPEAQMDRFMFRLSTGYAKNLKEEKKIAQRRVEWKKDDPTDDIAPVIAVKDFLQIQRLVEEDIYIDESILEYVSSLVRKTREHEMVYVGASPRGVLSLLKASRAIALIRGRDFVTPDDVKLIAKDALSHRIILKTDYVLEGFNEEKVVEDVLKEVRVPKEFSKKG